jgi:hydrogenase expression/formation protein HypE
MQKRILLAHGGGALLTAELIRSLIVERFDNPVLNRLDDSAVLPPQSGRLAFTSDSYVVSPTFFPGGNIGDLAVCGTVNDLAMSGAEPRFISLSLILEEGLPLDDLERILDSVRDRADEAGVQIVCGDTKVVPHGQADGVYINTAGIGVLPDGVDVSSANARPGDRLIVSGVLGLHGLAVMLSRGDFRLESPIQSDVAPLAAMVAALLAEGVELRALRDLTRGGLAAALSDVAEHSGVSLEVEESCIPSREVQRCACEILGLDPLHIACEGRLLAVVPEADAARAATVLRSFGAGAEAAIVGRANERGKHAMEFVTAIGSRRVITLPSGEQMPRIC